MRWVKIRKRGVGGGSCHCSSLSTIIFGYYSCLFLEDWQKGSTWWHCNGPYKKVENDSRGCAELFCTIWECENRGFWYVEDIWHKSKNVKFADNFARCCSQPKIELRGQQYIKIMVTTWNYIFHTQIYFSWVICFLSYFKCWFWTCYSTFFMCTD